MITSIATINSVEVLDAGKYSLSELGQRVQKHVQALEQHALKATQYAFEIGQLLNEAKPQVAHGEWEPWLLEHCHLAPRTARAYMRLAKELPTLSEPNRQRVADLPIREALKAIATDPTPPVKHSPTRRIQNIDERERVAAVFRNARSNLAKAARTVEYGFPIKGGEVAKLRKQLEAALEQLNELEGKAAPAAKEVTA